MEEKDKILCPHCGNELNIGKLLGSRTSDKKAASSANNGRKGGRPKILLDEFSVNAMKDGEMYMLNLEPMHILGGGKKAKYRFVICHPGGGQIDAEYQPMDDGSLPDIALLAEKNGFEVLDVIDFLLKK